jgi:hypothetical protein
VISNFERSSIVRTKIGGSPVMPHCKLCAGLLPGNPLPEKSQELTSVAAVALPWLIIVVTI